MVLNVPGTDLTKKHIFDCFIIADDVVTDGKNMEDPVQKIMRDGRHFDISVNMSQFKV